MNNYDIPSTIFNLSIGGLSIGLVMDMATNDIYLSFVDTTNVIAQNLNWDNSGWTFITIKRSGSDLIIYRNGVLLNTFALDAVLTYGGAFSRDVGFTGELYDIHGLPNAVSNESVLYFYNDMVNNNGKATLWPY